MKLTESAKYLIEQKYCSHGENPAKVFPRVGNTIMSVMKEDEDSKQFTKIMEDLDFLPNSPCIRNAGYSNQVKACFVLPVEDSMESIFTTLQRSALIFKSGGGVGYNFSELREKGAPLSHGGTSSGVMSFMKIYNSITEAVKQGGFRRGASMGVLDVDHPEILDFIKEKLRPGSMNNFNLSVMVTDDFMSGIEEDGKVFLRSRLDRRIITGKFNCRDLFNIMTYSAWLTGDPGLLFYDRINKDNPYYPKYPIRSTNPCGEVPLLPYESCCLGSINLSNFVTNDGEFDVDRFSDIVRISTKFLMGMNKICEFPKGVDECYIAQAKYLRIGLGVMGFADMLMKMGIMYDSDESLKMIDTIGEIMQESKKYAPQSVATLSIAPTGSLSIIADCSSGIEPWFSKSYTRHLTHGKVKESRESKYLRTAHDISPEWHLKVQARWQSYIDNGVSKTINLPHNATIQDVQDIYMSAWKMGCKGITIFRDGCLGDAGQVLRSTCEDENCYL
jgi:ribonucleoside-diphosphate reductase alpha chain